MSAISATEAPGRARRNSEATKASILAAARVEFAGKVLEGGRVDQIAHRAGVNKQLVYYYFGSKDELYTAALKAAYADIHAERELDFSALPQRDGSIGAAPGRIVSA